MRNAICVLTLCVASFVAAQIVPASTAHLSKEETAQLIHITATIAKRQAIVTEIQKALTAARSKGQSQQVTILTDAAAHNQSSLTHAQSFLAKYEAKVLAAHKLAVAGAVFSTDFTTVTGTTAN